MPDAVPTVPGRPSAKTLRTLFLEMFRLAAFVIGGGYVILSVADGRFSKRRRWIRPGELFEMLPLFQMIPGIIGAHTAVYVGNRVAGLPGAVAALSGMLLPSILIFLAISIGYRAIPVDSPLLKAVFLGLRAALTGVMLEIVLRTGRKSVTNPLSLAAVVLASAALLTDCIAPGRVILLGMLAGLAVEGLRKDRAPGAPGGETRVFHGLAALPLLFLGYGLLAFGGGFSLVPLYLRDFVGDSAPYLQLAGADFANVMALTEMTPGPVAANCATFFGYELGGVAGAFFATFLLVLPGSVILAVALASIERFRNNVFVRGIFTGVRPVTTALMISATWSFAGMSVWHTTPDGTAFSPAAAAIALLVFVFFYRRNRRA